MTHLVFIKTGGARLDRLSDAIASAMGFEPAYHGTSALSAQKILLEGYISPSKGGTGVTNAEFGLGGYYNRLNEGGRISSINQPLLDNARGKVYMSGWTSQALGDVRNSHLTVSHRHSMARNLAIDYANMAEHGVGETYDRGVLRPGSTLLTSYVPRGLRGFVQDADSSEAHAVVTRRRVPARLSKPRALMASIREYGLAGLKKVQ